MLLSYVLVDALTSKTRSWRLNETLLQDKEMLSNVTGELEFYFQTNNTSECDPNILWEAHKAVIHGVLIKHGSRIKKKSTIQLTSLFNDLLALESCHKHTPLPSLEK